MASIFSKMVRGASETGAVLFADMAREKLRSEIGAERDKVLHENRMRIQKDQQDFVAGQTSQARANELSDIERAKNSPRAQSDVIKLGSEQKLATLKDNYSKAETDAERSSIAKQIAAESGKPVENLMTKTGGGPTASQKEARVLATLDEFKNEAEALKFLKSKEGDMTKEIFKALVAQQETNMTREGEEGYLAFDEMLKKARDMAKPESQKPEVEEVVRPKITDEDKQSAARVSTQDEYDKLKSGALFFNTTNNKYMWKQ